MVGQTHRRSVAQRTVGASGLDAARLVRGGLTAALLSSAILAWRGKVELDSTAAANNAPSQYVHGYRALVQDKPSWAYTAVGVLVHTTMSMLWAGAFELLRSRRGRDRTSGMPGVLRDAALVTATAALVDLRVVPDRWSPGFQHRLTAPSTALVYLAFAAGLVLSGGLRSRQRSGGR